MENIKPVFVALAASVIKLKTFICSAVIIILTEASTAWSNHPGQLTHINSIATFIFTFLASHESIFIAITATVQELFANSCAAIIMPVRLEVGARSLTALEEAMVCVELFYVCHNSSTAPAEVLAFTKGSKVVAVTPASAVDE